MFNRWLESKLQQILRKIKLYPAGSYLYIFYGNAKVHKSSTNDVCDLTLRPIASNISTAIYEMARYLTNLLTSLSKSEFTINNTKEFIKYSLKENVPDVY